MSMGREGLKGVGRFESSGGRLGLLGYVKGGKERRDRD
jgi:hypothetical protein